MLKLSLKVYSLEAIKRTAYRFADKVAILLGPPDTEQVVEVHFTPLSSQNVEFEQLRAEFLVELGDQDLRECIARETQPLRNAIIAHAFSRSSLAPHE